MRKIPRNFLIVLLAAGIIDLCGVILPLLGNEFGFCMIGYYIIFPAVAFVYGCKSGKETILNKVLYILWAAAIGSLMPFPLFLNVWDTVGKLVLIVSAVGVILGTIEYRAGEKAKQEDEAGGSI